MEKIIINRNDITPYSEELCVVSAISETDNTIEVTISGLSHAYVGETLYFNKMFKGEARHTAKAEVVEVIDENTLIVRKPLSDIDYKMETIVISTAETYITLDKEYPLTPEDFLNDDVKLSVTGYTTGATALTSVTISILPVLRHRAITGLTTGDTTGLTEVNFRDFSVTSSTEAEQLRSLNYYETLPVRISKDPYIKEGKLLDNVTFTRDKSHYSINIGLTEQDETNLLQENTLETLFSDEIKSQIVPDVIDMEKVCFEPSVTQNGSVMANEIDFNLHFREREVEYTKILSPTSEVYARAKNRSGGIENPTVSDFKEYRFVKVGSQYYELTYKDGWYVNEDKDWNNTTYGISDAIGYLNFNDNDVRYQKQKVKKTFLRLSFYDSDNPLTQQLLYYSTLFLDSGELFGTYIKNRNKVGETYKYYDVFADDLNTKLYVKNKYNSDKSSDGFYLYLFNSEVTESEPLKYIYMKAEFNHAGYGRTLPMVKPYLNTQEEIVGVPYKNYFETAYLKLGIKYCKGSDNPYIYFVAEDSQPYITLDETNKKIILDLFEVKID